MLGGLAGAPGISVEEYLSSTLDPTHCVIFKEHKHQIHQQLQITGIIARIQQGFVHFFGDFCALGPIYIKSTVITSS
jgi:hypothetical protein